jgi:hypothetical protein
LPYQWDEELRTFSRPDHRTTEDKSILDKTFGLQPDDFRRFRQIARVEGDQKLRTQFG